MNIPDPSKRYTHEDWLKWEGRWELIDGKAYNMTPAPSSIHQFAVGELFFALRAFFQNKNCLVFTSPFDVFFSESANFEHPDDITQPDLVVICDKKKITPKGCLSTPDIVIEVLSPSTALKDYNEKFQTYQKYGVKEYWIVDTANRMIHVYHLCDGYYKERHTYGENDELHSSLFDDLKIKIKSVFSPLIKTEYPESI